MVSLVTLILAITSLAACAMARPAKTLANGPEGTISFESLTLTDREFIRGVTSGRPVVISGDLRLPRGATGRVPAMVIVHGSGGVTRGETQWAEDLVGIGVVAFVMDSFWGRGIREAGTDQSQIATFTMIVDAYRALQLLATHPRIDPARIGVMGLSKGGFVSLYASLRRFQRMHGPAGLEFAAYVPFYPHCNNRYIGDEHVSDRPIRIYHGEADDQSLIGPCRDYVARLRRAGKDAEIIGYPGAHHAFDNPDAGPTQTILALQNFSGCFLDERNPPTDGRAWVRACRQQGVTRGYDSAARADAARHLKTFLTAAFGLGR